MRLVLVTLQPSTGSLLCKHMSSVPCFACGKQGALTGGCSACDGAAVYCNTACFDADSARHGGFECELLGTPFAGPSDANFDKTAKVVSFAAFGFPEHMPPVFDAEMDLTHNRFFAVLPADASGRRKEVRLNLTSLQVAEANAAVAEYTATRVLRRRVVGRAADDDAGFMSGSFHYGNAVAPPSSVPRLVALFLALEPSLPLDPPVSTAASTASAAKIGTGQQGAHSGDILVYSASGFIMGTSHLVEVRLDTGIYHVGRHFGSRRVYTDQQLTVQQLTQLKQLITSAVREQRFRARTRDETRAPGPDMGSSWFEYKGLLAHPKDVPAIAALLLSIDPDLARPPGGL